MNTVGRRNVRIEIAEDTIARLLAQGQVCAADLRCLDCKSKECLWRLCLESCIKENYVVPVKGAEWKFVLKIDPR